MRKHDQGSAAAARDRKGRFSARRIRATVLRLLRGEDLESVSREWCFRHQLLLPRPYLVLTKPLRLDIQCQRGASVKIGWKYLDD